MVLANLTLSVMIVLGFSTVSIAMADSQDSVETAPGSMVHGSTEPEKIYDYLKYHLLIAGYESRVRGNLAEKLSLQDQQVLMDLAVQDPIERQRTTDEYKQARLHLCANRASMTPVEIAQKWEQIALEWRVKNEARLVRGLDSLSTKGRNIVEEFVASEIVPGIVQTAPGGGIDEVKRNPQEFMEAVDLECYVAINGEYPSDVQEQVDEVFRKLEENEGLTED